MTRKTATGQFAEAGNHTKTLLPVAQRPVHRTDLLTFVHTRNIRGKSICLDMLKPYGLDSMVFNLDPVFLAVRLV